MKRSLVSKTDAAQKALERAIAQETSHLQEVIRQKDSEISRLNHAMTQIITIAGGMQKSAPTEQVLTAPPPTIRIEEPELPQGPSVDLSDEDNLGTGRWV